MRSREGSREVARGSLGKIRQLERESRNRLKVALGQTEGAHRVQQLRLESRFETQNVHVDLNNYCQQNFCDLKVSLTPRFQMCSIGAFLPLRRDCARLRDHRMSWTVSKPRAMIFIS